MTWRKAETYDDAVEFLSICENTDPVSYPSSVIFGKVEYMAEDMFNDKFKNELNEYWIYTEQKAKCALRLVKYSDDPNSLRIQNFCGYGFSSDIEENWNQALPILMSKVRERADALGANKYRGTVPRTKNGEILAHVASKRTWETANVTLSADKQAWIMQFSRSDNKPVDEHLFLEDKETPVVITKDSALK